MSHDMSKHYELIIFDWDGTLEDSGGDWVGMYQQLIQNLGLPERSPAHLRELVGWGVQDALARLFPDFDPGGLRARLSRYRQRYGLPRPQPRLFTGVWTALERLRQQGYVLAVATSKNRRTLDWAMAQTQTREFFQLTRCADESASKPAPNMIEDILLRTATEPEAAVMVGDTEYDMAMAQAAGIDSLAVQGGIHEATRLLTAGAMVVLDDVVAVPDWLAARQRSSG